MLNTAPSNEELKNKMHLKFPNLQEIFILKKLNVMIFVIF
jgi:hypothetical protein